MYVSKRMFCRTARYEMEATSALNGTAYEARIPGSCFDLSELEHRWLETSGSQARGDRIIAVPYCHTQVLIRRLGSWAVKELRLDDSFFQNTAILNDDSLERCAASGSSEGDGDAAGGGDAALKPFDALPFGLTEHHDRHLEHLGELGLDLHAALGSIRH